MLPKHEDQMLEYHERRNMLLTYYDWAKDEFSQISDLAVREKLLNALSFIRTSADYGYNHECPAVSCFMPIV